ncbi:MFS transporter [Paraglaciecola aquimarina]|uniref:MFS transporter n=1 Tax=Paraglaciecola aquimarina TaxID=1235557 RepID=A0ABU3SW33_9ALTE|nr:MFS transporter [Paraglaciecola aquimarina]MDU0354214.1 MFS transporter [Paraglaciecola aquimarina]
MYLRIDFFGGVAKWFIYQPGHNWWLIMDAALSTSIWAGMGVLMHSMIADQTDCDENTHGVRREGIFVSLQNLIVQLSVSFAFIAAGFSLNVIGFEAELGAGQPSSTLLSMRIILVTGTCIAAALGYLVISHYKAEEESTNNSQFA